MYMYTHIILLLLASYCPHTLASPLTTAPLNTIPINTPSEKAEVALGDDMTLDVTYYPTIRLPLGYRITLSTVIHQAEEFYTPDSVVHPPYTWEENKCVFKAQAFRTAKAPLTYGLLVEAIDVLGQFTLYRPFALSVVVREGETLEGSPVGFLSLK
ncbi:MAG: hypothetical protein Q9218_008190, partial [Villophora microphyllina]